MNEQIQLVEVDELRRRYEQLVKVSVATAGLWNADWSKQVVDIHYPTIIEHCGVMNGESRWALLCTVPSELSKDKLPVGVTKQYEGKDYREVKFTDIAAWMAVIGEIVDDKTLFFLHW